MHQNSIHTYLSKFAVVLTALGFIAWSPTGAAEHPFSRPAGAGLTVVTLNMAREANPDRILAEWRRHPQIWNADVLALQEVVHFAGERPSIAHLLGKEMGFYVVSQPNLPNQNTDGLAILSRYPLKDFETHQLRHYDLGYRNRTRIMIAATVETPSGPVRVFDTHLDTRINPDERLQQLGPVIAEAAKWNGPRVIAGDFNTNYFRWIRNVVPVPFAFQAAAVRHAMAAQGFTTPLIHTGPTHDNFGFQLDWVYTRGIDAVGTAIQPLDFSDHHAVCVQLRVGQALSPVI